MKIIDILNKIANGEQPPKKIIFRNVIYDYDEEERDYYNNEYDALFDYHEITDILNEEVQVLETTIIYNNMQNNKQDKITKIDRSSYVLNAVNKILTEEMIEKINALIDRVNDMEV